MKVQGIAFRLVVSPLFLVWILVCIVAYSTYKIVGGFVLFMYDNVNCFIGVVGLTKKRRIENPVRALGRLVGHNCLKLCSSLLYGAIDFGFSIFILPIRYASWLWHGKVADHLKANKGDWYV